MKSITCEKLIDIYQNQLLEFFIFDPDVRIVDYKDQIVNSKKMFKNLIEFLDQLDCSVDSLDYERLLSLIGIYRNAAFENDDNSMIEKCNEMIIKANSIKLDQYNLYIRKFMSSLKCSSINLFKPEIEPGSMKKIFEMNLSVIKMLFDDDETSQIHKIIYLSRNELFFYSIKYLFNSSDEILSDLDVLSNLLSVIIVNREQKNNGIPLFVENPRMAYTNNKYYRKIKKIIRRESN